MTPFVFSTTPSIVFASGAAARIGELGVPKLGARILFVTDKGLMKAGLAGPAIAALEAAGAKVAVFDAVEADPSERTVHATVTLAQAFACSGVVGFGGGSSMDVAKLAALLALGREELGNLYGTGNVKGPRLPLLLVPTTAGTGSEVTGSSIVTTGESEKKGVLSPILMPDIAILDPDLTLGLPAPITAATGVDAMVHAIEAYSCVNPNKNPVSLTLAREALRLLSANIRAVIADGTNREARGAMLLGSMLAGQAFANSPVGAVHALAYPLGGIYHLPHGLTNALVLPHVMRFNASDPGCARSYAEIAPDILPALAALPPAERVEALIAEIVTLSRDVGLPARLGDVGIPRDAVPRLAADAMKQQRLLGNNPRKVSEADALAIYGAAA